MQVIFSRSAVNVLLPELLLEVLMHNTALDLRWNGLFTNSFYPKEIGYTDGRADPSKPTRVASQVCRHWRQVVLNAPHLWSRLIDCDLLPSRWFNEVLRRAHNSPLTVLCRQTYDSSDSSRRTTPNLEHLLASRKEFRELHLQFQRHVLSIELEQALLQRLEEPMQYLTKFCVDCVGYRRPHYINGETPNLTSEHELHLFGGTSPILLRRVTLSHPLEVKHVWYQFVTSLAIGNVPIAYPILSMLSHIPQLQDLAIWMQRDQPSIPESEFGPSNRISLPFLTHIRITGYFMPTLLLLDSLDTAALIVVIFDTLNSKPKYNGCLNPFDRLLDPTRLETPPLNTKVTILLAYYKASIEIITFQGHVFSLEVDCSGCATSRDIMSLLGVYRPLFPTCTFLDIGYYAATAGYSHAVIFQDEILVDFLLLLDHTEIVYFRNVEPNRVLGLLETEEMLPALKEVHFPCLKATDPSHRDIFNKIENILDQKCIESTL